MNEFMNRVGRPVQNVSRGGADAPAPQNTGGGKKKNKIGLAKVVSSVLVILVTILLIALIVGVAFGSKTTSTASQIQTDKYQAIFLNSSDGQVYFGKLTVLNKDNYKLTDIYYVRVQQVQPDKNTQAQQNISLAKLGSEIHGPQDVMYINKSTVLFWENLKDDGEVVKAIKDYQKTGSTTGGSGTANPSTPATINP